MIDIYDENFGEKVKQSMRYHGFTQRELARILGTSSGFLVRVLKKPPEIEEYTRILEFLDFLENSDENEDSDDSSFKEHIRKRIRCCGISQEEFADRLGIERHHLGVLLKEHPDHRKRQMLETMEAIESTLPVINDDDSFETKLKKRMKRCGVSYERFARVMGVSKRVIDILLAECTIDIADQMLELLATMEKEQLDEINALDENDYASRIKKKIQRCGFTQNEFTQMMGMPSSYFHHLTEYPYDNRKQVVEALEKMEIEYHRSGKGELKTTRKDSVKWSKYKMRTNYKKNKAMLKSEKEAEKAELLEGGASNG